MADGHDRDLPDDLRDANPPVQRTYDALREADSALSRNELQRRTRDAESTVLQSLRDLRNAGLVERVDRWPVPLYGLDE